MNFTTQLPEDSIQPTGTININGCIDDDATERQNHISLPNTPHPDTNKNTKLHGTDDNVVICQPKITTNNIFAFGSLYFIEGISYGHTCQFLPLVLAAKYRVDVDKVTFTRAVFLPWLLKPLFAQCLPNPNLKSLKICWILLIICSLFWVVSFQENGLLSGISVWQKVLVCGVVIQLVTAVFDVVVDYIQVCTLRSRSTLGWVKTLETGLYKVGSILAGSALLLVTQSIYYSILTMLIAYILVGGVAIYYFKLPPLDTCSNTSETEVLHPADSNDTIKKKIVEKKGSYKTVFKALYYSKFFMLYLFTYKMFQGTLQSLIPIWMKTEACLSLQQVNLITGIIPSITSLLGTVLGGSIPGMVAKQMKSWKDEEMSVFMQIVKDIWFWLIFIMFLFSIITNVIVELEDFSSLKAPRNSSIDICNSTLSVLSNEQNSIQRNTTKIVIVTMFIFIGFIGGIITPLTFTEMTVKTQTNVDIDSANKYLSWFSTFEVCGKFINSIFCGSLVKLVGYQATFYFATGIQLICLLSYLLSKFEKPP